MAITLLTISTDPRRNNSTLPHPSWSSTTTRDTTPSCAPPRSRHAEVRRRHRSRRLPVCTHPHWSHYLEHRSGQCSNPSWSTRRRGAWHAGTSTCGGGWRKGWERQRRPTWSAETWVRRGWARWRRPGSNGLDDGRLGVRCWRVWCECQERRILSLIEDSITNILDDMRTRYLARDWDPGGRSRKTIHRRRYDTKRARPSGTMQTLLQHMSSRILLANE